MRRPVRHQGALHRATTSCSKDPNVDAVHINSPIPDHAPQSIAALKAGKHVACTVPMATTDRGVPADRRGAAQERQGLHDDGDRRLQPRVPVRQGAVRQGRARAASSSCAAATSRTWTAGPATGRACRRCTTPRTASARAWRMLGKHAEHVVCHGSGRIDEALIPKYGSPFAIETATFKMRDSDVCAEVTRSLFDTARQYRESFDVYGSKKSFEWQQVENEEPVIHTKSTPRAPLTEARDPAAGEGARLRPPAARADPQVHAAGGDPGRRAPVVPAGRRPRRLAPAPGRTTS